MKPIVYRHLWTGLQCTSSSDFSYLITEYLVDPFRLLLWSMSTPRFCSCTLTEVHLDDGCFNSEIQLFRIFEEHNQAPYYPSHVRRRLA